MSNEIQQLFQGYVAGQKRAPLRPSSSDYGPLLITFHVLGANENTLFNICIT